MTNFKYLRTLPDSDIDRRLQSIQAQIKVAIKTGNEKALKLLNQLEAEHIKERLRRLN